MSVIAVKKYSDKIIIAADSQASWGNNKEELKNASIGKMFSVNNIIVGSAGSVLELNLFRNFCSSRKPKGIRIDDILQFLVEFSQYAKGIKSDFVVDNHYLIVFDKKIFRCIGFDVSEVDGFSAIGSGMWLAIGALELEATPQEAVGIAKKFDLYCGGKTLSITIKL